MVVAVLWRRGRKLVFVSVFLVLFLCFAFCAPHRQDSCETKNNSAWKIRNKDASLDHESRSVPFLEKAVMPSCGLNDPKGSSENLNEHCQFSWRHAPKLVKGHNNNISKMIVSRLFFCACTLKRARSVNEDRFCLHIVDNWFWKLIVPRQNGEATCARIGCCCGSVNGLWRFWILATASRKSTKTLCFWDIVLLSCVWTRNSNAVAHFSCVHNLYIITVALQIHNRQTNAAQHGAERTTRNVAWKGNFLHVGNTGGSFLNGIFTEPDQFSCLSTTCVCQKRFLSLFSHKIYCFVCLLWAQWFCSQLSASRKSMAIWNPRPQCSLQIKWLTFDGCILLLRFGNLSCWTQNSLAWGTKSQQSVDGGSSIVIPECMYLCDYSQRWRRQHCNYCPVVSSFAVQPCAHCSLVGQEVFGCEGLDLQG